MKNPIYSSLLAILLVFCFTSAQEKLTNGNFEAGKASWTLSKGRNDKVTFNIDSINAIAGTKSGHIFDTTTSSASLFTNFPGLTQKKYIYTFKVRASRDTLIGSQVVLTKSPSTILSQRNFKVGTTVTTCKDSAYNYTNDSLRFAFNLGNGKNVEYWFDDVSVIETAAGPEATSLSKAPGVEKVSNGLFESGQTPWTLALTGSGAATFKIDSVTAPIQGRASGLVAITNSTGTESDIQLTQTIAVLKGKRYYISFKGYASQNTAVKVVLRQKNSPFNDLVMMIDSLSTTSKVFFDTTGYFTADDSNINLTFLFGNSGNAQIWLDYVSVIENTMPAALNIVIDAQRDAWYDALSNPNDGKIYIPSRALIQDIGTAPPRDNADISGIIWSAWDSTYIYYYAEVHDDIILVNNATVWSNDRMELKYDPDPTIPAISGNIQVSMSALDSSDAQLPAAVDNLSFDKALLDIHGSFWGGGSPQRGKDFARRRTLDGYVLEWRIPLQYINTTTRILHPGVGGKFGSVIEFADNDATARQHMISWSAKMVDNSWTNPECAGTVTFLADNKLKWEAVNSIFPTTKNDSASVWYFGTSGPVSGVKASNNLPGAFALSQNYPNPFNPTTTIEFSLPVRSSVHLVLFSVLGQVVKEIVNGDYTAGTHRITLDASTLATGVYFYKLKAGQYTNVKKLLLMK
jgi:hypothetical protein